MWEQELSFDCPRQPQYQAQLSVSTAVKKSAGAENSSEEICCPAENFPRHRPGMRERGKHPSEHVATKV